MAGSLDLGPVSAPIIPLTLTGIGLYLAWFGVHYWRSDTKWPTDPIKEVLTGGTITPPNTPPSYAAEASSAVTVPTPTENQTGSGAVAGGTYTHADLVRLWTVNGGDPTTAGFAADVAMAESSGESNATSNNPDGGTNAGLWQLDTKGVGSGYTVAQLQAPDTNCRITIMATRNGRDWREWSDPVVNSLPGRMYA